MIMFFRISLVLILFYGIYCGNILGQEAITRDSFQVPQEGLPEIILRGIEFEAPSALAFDSKNRPYMFNSREPESFGYILTLRDNEWIQLSYLDSLKKKYPRMQMPKRRFLHALGTIAIDNSDAIYVIMQIEKYQRGKGYVLLYSPDLNGNFQVYDLPGKAFMEIQTGFNKNDHPPVIGSLIFRKEHEAKWTDYHYLDIFIPQKKGNKLHLGEPIQITDKCFGLSNHSGGYSFAATSDSSTHLVFAEISEEEDGGNPTFVATIDRNKREVVANEFLVIAPPRVPDVHSTPVISADSSGYLHILAGAHSQPFQYLRSLAPDTIYAGWTESMPMSGRQTYTTLLCTPDNYLHSVYRIHPHLLYQRKPAMSDSWSDPVILINPPDGHEGYSIYYHRLFIDRKGTIYLSYTFYEEKTGQEGRYPRTLVVSEDHGTSWRKATTDSFSSRVFGDNSEQDFQPIRELRLD